MDGWMDGWGKKRIFFFVVVPMIMGEGGWLFLSLDGQEASSFSLDFQVEIRCDEDMRMKESHSGVNSLSSVVVVSECVGCCYFIQKR